MEVIDKPVTRILYNTFLQ